MSLISEHKGRVFAPGFFLADPENCERRTRQMSADKGVAGDYGTKYIPMGTIYPANDNTAEGIVYEDVDVTDGDTAGLWYCRERSTQTDFRKLSQIQ